MASKSAWVTDPGRQNQNPERGRKPSQKRASIMRVALMSSDPKPREGTETMLATIFAVVVLMSSDPKPREGTETRGLWPKGADFACSRQTQNPERGRKPDDEQRHTEPRIRQVVRPKTPRGDGNLHPLVADTADFRESSDPKPREGTETGNCVTARLAGRCRQTQNPERGRKHHPTQAPKSMTSRRQTQNPERGRKLVRHLCLIQVQCPVVRPKTPRGDGNLTARSFPASIR